MTFAQSRLGFLVCSLAVGAALPAQGLLADLEPLFDATGSSHPADLVVSGGRLFFTAIDSSNERELWTSDGTTLGTRLVRDVRPGLSSGPGRLVSLDDAGRIVFAADDGVHGPEPWVSDGTAAGTFMLRDISGAGQAPTSFTRVGNQVLFVAAPGANFELWRTDGTTAGTVFVSAVSARLDESVAFQGQLVFAGTDASGDAEPWISDGTPQGTRRIADVNPVGSSSPGAFAVIAGRCLFRANDGVHGSELWASDGTAAGTVMVADIWSGPDGSVPSNCYGVPGAGYALFTPFLRATGWELWRTDGTPSGTYLVADLAPGPFSSAPRALFADRGWTYFSARTETEGDELWRTDGTAANTAQVRDLAPGIAHSDPRGFQRIGNDLVFLAANSLWRTDGTQAGTQVLEDRHVLTAFAGLGGRAYFGFPSGGVGVELCSNDLTPRGTSLVRDIHQVALSSSPANFVRLGDQLLFTATTAGEGYELWRTDGRAAGTSRVAVTLPGVNGELGAPVRVGDRVFFRADAPGVGAELWCSDGTAAGTRVVRDINPGSLGSNVRHIVEFGGDAFFTAFSGAALGLWRSDGTAAGTFEVPLPGWSHRSLTVAGNRLFFVALAYLGAGEELWVSDGTASGTAVVADLVPGPVGAQPEQLTAFGARLLFVSSQPSVSGLWVSDGTALGTQRLWTGAVQSLVVSRDAGWFFTEDALWRTDGTVAGTVRVHTLPASFSGRLYANANFVWLHRRTTQAHELWLHDIAAQSIRQIYTATTNEGPTEVTPLGDGPYLLFSAPDQYELDRELWWSDEQSAHLLAIRPGIASSSPADFAQLGRQILFRATDHRGVELWSLDVGDLPAAATWRYGRGCPGTGGLVPDLGALAPPQLGATCTLSTVAALANAPVAFGFGPGPAEVPLGSCFILRSQPSVYVYLGSGATGRADLPLPVPNAVHLLGQALAAQAVVFDPQGAFNNALSFSNGLLLVIGR